VELEPDVGQTAEKGAQDGLLVDKVKVQMELSETQQRAEELFAEGNQFLAQKYYLMTSDLLLKLDRNEEAQIYADMAADIKQTSDNIARMSEDLEHRKLINDFEGIFALCIDLIELSKKLNDSKAIENFQSEIIQLIKNDYISREDLAQTLIPIGEKANKLENAGQLDEAIKLRKRAEIISTLLVSFE
jgi:tetratricopeptide (TPR) repeat protein